MSEKTPFDNFVDEVRSALTKALHKRKEPGYPDTERWLEALLTHYTDRMLSDNERIWRTGALFVPIALAAFAALTTIKCVQWWHIVLLGFASTGLMWAWIVIAENHRSFQQKSEAWIKAIQQEMGLNSEVLRKQKIEAEGREARVTKRGAIQDMRWTLFNGTWMAWIIILLLWCVGLLPSQCP